MGQFGLKIYMQNLKKQYLKIVFKSIFVFYPIFFFGCDSKDLRKIDIRIDTNSSSNSGSFVDDLIVDVLSQNNSEKIEKPLKLETEKTFKVDSQQSSVYSGTPNDPIYFYQWHLKTLETENIWSKYTGKSIKVSVVDSGVEAKHPDLINNIDFNLSKRYSDNSNNPSPDNKQLRNSPEESAHGTACAGIIGAEGWNGKGVIGVAPNVNIVGFNTFSTGEDADFEDALGNIYVDISSNSWGGQVSTTLYDDPASMRGIENGIKLGRNGKGVIYTFASGNEGNNANYSTLHGSRFVFNIGAVVKSGEVPSYSNFGDNVLITAPAGDEKLNDNQGIFTTDLLGIVYGFNNKNQYLKILQKYNGDYTGLMNGTSSAVPVASGVIALILQANPKLTYRDVKYILSKTAKVSNSNNLKYRWEKNGAGIYFSPYYGFGVINLIDSVEMAESFKLLSKQVSIEKKAFPNKKVPDNSETGVFSIIEIQEDLKIEHVAIEINIPTHKSIGDLKITLTSPNGTVSTLMYGDKKMRGVLSNWEFNSLKFLDENSNGDWTLKVFDKRRGYTGVLESWKIFIYGRED